jgi:hypothetical protein
MVPITDRNALLTIPCATRRVLCTVRKHLLPAEG